MYSLHVLPVKVTVAVEFLIDRTICVAGIIWVSSSKHGHTRHISCFWKGMRQLHFVNSLKVTLICSFALVLFIAQVAQITRIGIEGQCKASIVGHIRESGAFFFSTSGYHSTYVALMALQGKFAAIFLLQIRQILSGLLVIFTIIVARIQVSF